MTDLEDLRARITATRWPDPELVGDFSQGVQEAVMPDLARYWATGYDMRRSERRLSALPHFVTEIDGLDIHFIHVRSPHENALPVIITYGWPGSVIELLNIIDPLTNPTAHGATAADAFDVVIPSIPGYGFSGQPRDLGWGPVQVAQAWDILMKRLGYYAATWRRAATGARSSPISWACRRPRGCSASTATWPASSRRMPGSRWPATYSGPAAGRRSVR